MKNLITIILVACLSLSTFGASVLVNVRDITSLPVNNRRVTVTLVQPGPVALGNWIFAGDNKAQFTDATGITTFTNMLTLGSYRLDVAGAPSRSYLFCISSTNGTWNVTQLFGDCTTNNIVQYYTADQIDAMLAGLGGGGVTANLFFGSGDPNGVQLAIRPALLYSLGGAVWSKTNSLADANGWTELIASSIAEVPGAASVGSGNFFFGLSDPTSLQVAARPALYYSLDGGVWVKTNALADDLGWLQLIAP